MLEHYCTLFDRKFLTLGMALHQSLLRHAGDFQLWILCMDDTVEANLRALDLERVRLIPRHVLESQFPVLHDVRDTREWGEYCWTCTPFLPELILRLDPTVARTTYVDADVFFFGSPAPILDELDRSGAQVLITEHSYTPDADHTDSAGRFNVQFMPFTRSDKAFEILKWWQSRCIACCTNESASGSYGDQKYLDEWPARYGTAVHILKDVEMTLGPWNVRHLWRGGTPKGSYHYSGLRIFEGGEAMLFPAGHPVVIPFRVMLGIYLPYVLELKAAWKTCREHGIQLDLPPSPRKSFFLLRRMVRFLRRIQWWTRVDRGPWRSFLGWTPFQK